MKMISWFLTVLIFLITSSVQGEEKGKGLSLSWEKHMLRVSGDHVPGKSIEIWYIEAYCRPGSTDREWSETVIGHETEMLSAAEDGSELKLRCTLKDGVVVDHRISVGERGDVVLFEIEARNPTEKASEAHWAQPCVRVGKFTGTGADATEDKYAYLPKTFVYLDGKPTFLPARPWALKARYVPGQVWCPKSVPRDDVNPRPLSELVPSHGLMGCVSADEKWALGVAFAPYQELFAGVIRCLHSDFRIGGLEPGEKKKIEGRLYVVANDLEALKKRYAAHFPKQAEREKKGK